MSVASGEKAHDRVQWLMLSCCCGFSGIQGHHRHRHGYHRRENVSPKPFACPYPNLIGMRLSTGDTLSNCSSQLGVESESSIPVPVRLELLFGQCRRDIPLHAYPLKSNCLPCFAVKLTSANPKPLSLPNSSWLVFQAAK